MEERRPPGVTEHEVHVQAGRVSLPGNLALTEDGQGLVLFAHGSGSTRFSPRNRYVARTLQEAGISTLLFDLLTDEEEAIDLRTAELRFNISLLAQRVAGAVDWIRENPTTAGLAIGCFGASTGAAAALVAAAERPEAVGAVVSRGGRPDLAGPVLPHVKAPTLLIVGGNDVPVIGMNQTALAQMTTEARLEIVPGATHLFEESGTLEAAARMAADWFTQHLARD